MYLFGVLLGLIMAQEELRAPGKSQRSVIKKLIRSISTRLGPTVRKEILERYNSEILEIQRGKVVGIDPKTALFGNGNTPALAAQAGHVGGRSAG